MNSGNTGLDRKEVGEHLGGFVPGGDEATWYPGLWRWFFERKGCFNILDVGCGDGIAVDYFRSLGANAWGVDGVWQPHEKIVEHDYTFGPITVTPGLPHDGSKYDLIWCCEFVEHVEEPYVYNFLDTFAKGKIVAMTHAEPGQQGHHHVNCQYAPYWIDKLRGIGFELDIASTFNSRTIAAENRSPYNHYRRSGLIFRAIE